MIKKYLAFVVLLSILFGFGLKFAYAEENISFIMEDTEKNDYPIVFKAGKSKSKNVYPYILYQEMEEIELGRELILDTLSLITDKDFRRFRYLFVRVNRDKIEFRIRIQF